MTKHLTRLPIKKQIETLNKKLETEKLFQVMKIKIPQGGYTQRDIKVRNETIEEIEKLIKTFFDLKTLRILENLPEEREYDFLIDKIWDLYRKLEGMKQ